MASSFGIYSVLVSIVFVFMLIGPSFSEKHTKLKKICSKTSDRDWCMNLMQFDSRTTNADIRGLTEVAIDLAYSKAKDIDRDLNSRFDYRIDYQFNEGYNLCSKNYQDAIRDIEQARKLFYDADYKHIAIHVNDAKEKVRDCKNQFKNYSSDIKRWDKEFGILCEVIKVSTKSFSDDSNSLFTKYP